MLIIKEKRIDSIYHGQLYQSRVTRAFKKRVRTKKFAPGQLVLKRIFLHQEEDKGNSCQIGYVHI